MLTDDRVPARSRQGRHIEDIANVEPATRNCSSATHLPRITINRRDADKGGNAAPVGWPSSGRSAIKVRAVMPPTPGTGVNKVSAARQIGEALTVLSVS